MKKQEIILKFYREHKTYNQIGSELNLDWRTVKKYIDLYGQQQKQLRSSAKNKSEQTELQSDIIKTPEYKLSQGRNKRKLHQNIQDKIDSYLLENQQKREQGYHKQLLKKQDIYSLLKEQGFVIGYTSVCNYISNKAVKKHEAYIKQLYEPGNVCEFDWGEVKLEIGGQQKKYQLAVFTSAYSNYRYARLYHRQDQYCLSDAHALFFEHIGGSFGQMVYDNTRTVISKFIGRHEKEPTELLLQLSTYYRFGYRFCNARRGNEKGHVERSVEYVRRKAFAYQYQFETVELAQEYLESILIKLNTTLNQQGSKPQVLFEEERKVLNPNVPRFEYFISENLSVDKYSTLCYQTNHYSVPDYFTGKILETKIYPSTIKCYYHNQLICSFPRYYTRGGWHIRLDDYLRTMHRKPGALLNSLALNQAEKESKDIYNEYFKQSPREFIELLLYQKEKTIATAKVLQIIQQIIEKGLGEITFDKIRYLVEQKQQPVIKQPVVEDEIEQASLFLIHQVSEIQKLHIN